MMRCKDAQRFIFDYLDSRLCGAVRNDFEAHLKACPECKEAVEEIKGQVGLLRSVNQLEVPPRLWNLIEARLKAAARQKRFVLFRLRPAITFAAAVILLLLSLYLAVSSRWLAPGPPIEKRPAGSDFAFYLEEHAWLENTNLSSSDAFLLAEASVKENGG